LSPTPPDPLDEPDAETAYVTTHARAETRRILKLRLDAEIAKLKPPARPDDPTR
jgi:hypothetical protein